MSERKRGIIVLPFPADDIEVNGPDDHYALLVTASKRYYMIHSEGVGYEVTAGRPWCWTDHWDECPRFTARELVDRWSAYYGEKPPATVVTDLADWIRVFGDRLENNFSLWRDRAVRG